MTLDLRGAGKWGYWCGSWCFSHRALRLDGGLRLRKRHSQRAFRGEIKRRAYKHLRAIKPMAQHGTGEK